MFGYKRKQVKTHVQAEDVAVIQSFVDSIDYLFKTMTDFLTMVNSNGKTMQLPTEYLVQMNEVVIQSLNVFGSTCEHYKSNKKMLSVGSEQYETNWAKLTTEQKKMASKYGRYMEMALKGKKTKLYPLIQRSKEQQVRDSKPENVNGAFAPLINARCPINKKAEKDRADFQNIDRRHEAMHESQKRKSKQRRGMNKTKYVQPTPNEMIAVPGQNNIRFQSGSGDSVMKDQTQRQTQRQRAVNNTFLVKELSMTDNKTGQKIKSWIVGLPAQIITDYGHAKDIKFAQESETLPKVPSQYFFSGDVSVVQQRERDYILKNGALGYKSTLSVSEEKQLIQTNKAMNEDLMPGFSYQ